MVSPCVSTRVSPSKGNTQFYSRSQFVVGTIQSDHPLEFRIPQSNGKACGHPKQVNSRTKNDIASTSRKLGSIRSTLITTGSFADEGGIENESEQIALARSKLFALKEKVRSNTLSRATEGLFGPEDHDKGRNGGHLTNSIRQRRQGTTPSSSSTMLTNSGHKKAYSSSTSSCYEQTVPDARRDPYNVHKWRRKSSRRKYAGMESSPILAQRLKQDAEFRKATGVSELESLLPEDRAIKFLSELTKKPRVPLPGRNMLPSLHLHPRSETGNSGREEVSVRFARNMAMEELEKRFHDNSWKTKHLGNTKNKEVMEVTRENARREYIRNVSLRRAGYLLPVQRHRGDMTQTNSVLDSSGTSPAKNYHHAQEQANLVFPNDGYIQRCIDGSEDGGAKNFSSSDSVEGEFEPSQSTAATHVAEQNNGILSDAVKFQIFDDSFSEETVTIICKPLESLSPTRHDSKPLQDFNTISFSTRKHASQTLSKGDTRSERMKQPSVSSPSMVNVRPDGRYKTLRNLTNDEFTRYPNHDSIPVMKKQTGVLNRHEKFIKSTQSSLKSSRHETRFANTFPKREVLPPINSLEIQFRNENNVDRKRTMQKVPKQSNEVASLSPPVRSPVSKKSVSSKNSPLSHASNFSFGTKGSRTPVASNGSQNTTGGRRKSRKYRRFSRMESKGSPQFQKALKQSKVAKLMRKWRIVTKTVIMINRLYNDHHIMSDDSYNIHFVSSSNQQQFENDVKKEVLFDLSDYKMKNQQKLSDTTRKILMTRPEQRTHQDVKIIQTTLRNIKAVSDHSANVQMNIAKHGYVVRLSGKRVVVLENRVPLNFYILLAGSAVIIKKDESGNTNPISFIKRGDIFGEREILNNESWNWSMVTVDPCEFLLLDRNDYIRIFVAGGMGGLLNDPDRGTFLKNLTLFRGWPMELINSNPNRCIFRYFKRGALLVRDGEESDWIFVIKSGSCSVVKPIKVETFTTRQIFDKLMDEQTAKFSASLQGDLVERMEESTKEEHLQLLEEIEHSAEAQKPPTTAYQQMEIASLLKEFNIEMKNSPLTPVEEEDENIGKDSSVSQTGSNIEVDQVDPTLSIRAEGEFRMSRISDQGAPPRTPSPMKAAYLQTGYSSPIKATTKNHDFVEGNLRTMQKNTTNLLSGDKNARNVSAQEKVAAVDSSFANSTSDEKNSLLPDAARNERNDDAEKHKPVYINIRQLTKGNSFGLDSFLFHEQPNLALVSNGAECLLLNKKFYFDNVTDEVVKNLRQAEHPYPSDTDLLESYWRLLTWEFFKKRVMTEVYKRKGGSRRR